MIESIVVRLSFAIIFDKMQAKPEMRILEVNSKWKCFCLRLDKIQKSFADNFFAFNITRNKKFVEVDLSSINNFLNNFIFMRTITKEIKQWNFRFKVTK